jgi:hypothetical protein
VGSSVLASAIGEVRMWYGSAWSWSSSVLIAMLLVQPDYLLMGFPWCLDERGEKLT